MILSDELGKINPPQFVSAGVKTLSREEIEQLQESGFITPLEQIRERSMGPRVSFPDRLNATTFGLRLTSKRVG